MLLMPTILTMIITLMMFLCSCRRAHRAAAWSTGRMHVVPTQVVVVRQHVLCICSNAFDKVSCRAQLRKEAREAAAPRSAATASGFAVSRPRTSEAWRAGEGDQRSDAEPCKLISVAPALQSSQRAGSRRHRFRPCALRTTGAVQRCAARPSGRGLPGTGRRTGSVP